MHSLEGHEVVTCRGSIHMLRGCFRGVGKLRVRAVAALNVQKAAVLGDVGCLS